MEPLDQVVNRVWKEARMPAVSKQTLATATGSQPKPAVTRPALVDVQPGIKLLLFGRSGSGKTRLACTFPKPLLLIGTELGYKSVANVRKTKKTLRDNLGNEILLYALYIGDKYLGIDFIKMENTELLNFLPDWLPQNNYKSFAVDHAGGSQDMMLKEVLGLDKVPAQKSWGLADQRSWGVVGNDFKVKYNQMLDLADRKGMDAVIVAHERNFNEGVQSDVMLPSVACGLTPTCKDYIHAACDYTGQTYIREQVITSESGDGGLDIPVATKTGKKEFCLRVAPHEIFAVKFRSLGDNLPDSIVNPNYEKIVQVINGTYKP